MNWSNGERLYNLLPSIYRIRDHEQGEPLRALLSVLESELDVLERDTTGLYENWFIETCDAWVIPYLGDLLGVRGLRTVESSGLFSQRAYVANTLRYRRRKGTLAMLEDLARDVTGWAAHAVEGFELLGWTQNLNHLRFERSPNPEARFPDAVDRVGTVNLRNLDLLDRLDGPFDRLSHTVDVRPIGQYEGRHNLRKVGVFLWRLGHYPLTDVPARRSVAHPHGYHLSPLGGPSPLFTNPQHRIDRSRITEPQVPGPIRPLAFYNDTEAYYGRDLSLSLTADGTPVDPAALLCKNLGAWDPPPAGRVAVDVRLGRIAFAPGEEPADVRVDYTYGFSADVGGGPYDRRAGLTDPATVDLHVVVAKGTAVDTLQKAVQQWTDAGQPDCLIQIVDNCVYGGNFNVTLPEGGLLAVEAANGRRPDVRLVGIPSLTAPDGGGVLRLNGLLIEGALELNGALDLSIDHCTLVPGRQRTEEGEPAFPDRDSLVVGTASADMKVALRKSICGPIRLPEITESLSVVDGVVCAPPVGGAFRPAIAADDAATEPGPPTTLERVTLWGGVFVREMTLASEVLFNAPARAARRQAGCVRFSYVPPGSVLPTRYRCQPDLALAARAEALGLESPGGLPPDERTRTLARLRPEYTSERYGDPGFAQLSLHSAPELRTGAEDGSEMGAFSLLRQPQREANLRARLEEYLPFGLEAGPIYVT